MAPSSTDMARLLDVDENTYLLWQEALSADDQQVLDQMFASPQFYAKTVFLKWKAEVPITLLLLIYLIEHYKMLRILASQLSDDQKLCVELAYGYKMEELKKPFIQ